MKMLRENTIGIVLVAAGILLAVLSYGELLRVLNQQSKEYQMNVTQDSVKVFDGERVVGTIKLEGQLDLLITKDNQ